MPQHPISKIIVPGDLQMKSVVTLEVMREFGQEGDWHDRYVQNAETKVDLTTLC